MKQEEITTLARECAEECIDPQGFSKSTYEELVEEKAENVAYILRWLSARFCLVEKSKVESVYNTTWNSWYHTLDVGTKGKNQCVLDVLHFLFPEIAKEVEG